MTLGIVDVDTHHTLTKPASNNDGIDYIGGPPRGEKKEHPATQCTRKRERESSSVPAHFFRGLGTQREQPHVASARIGH